jgi:hypothetical protein
MSVLEVQRLLARLYTDPALLKEYIADRAVFSARHAGRDAELIGEIDSRQLEFFASSLRVKRAGEVKKLLRMTVAALGSRFAEEFEGYAALFIPAGERKHLADAMAFCEHLIRARTLEKQVVEAASFELSEFRIRFDLRREGETPIIVSALPSHRPWIRLMRFRYMSSALTGEEVIQGKNHRRRFVLFARVPLLRGIWYW